MHSLFYGSWISHGNGYFLFIVILVFIENILFLWLYCSHDNNLISNILNKCHWQINIICHWGTVTVWADANSLKKHDKYHIMSSYVTIAHKKLLWAHDKLVPLDKQVIRVRFMKNWVGIKNQTITLIWLKNKYFDYILLVINQ